jgi:hypothetical protein
LDRKTSIRALIAPRRHDWSHMSRARRGADGMILVCLPTGVVHGWPYRAKPGCSTGCLALPFSYCYR